MEQTNDVLKGKKILIVDDEPDILETLEELLDMCSIDTAPDYDTAVKFLEKETYDAAIFDIMGVDGYSLLKIARAKNIPTLMLTAHALSPENLIKSIKSGAESYIPKEKMLEIPAFLAEMLLCRRGKKKHANWLEQLKPFFDKKFGADWQEDEKVFLDDLKKRYHGVSREELDDVL